MYACGLYISLASGSGPLFHGKLLIKLLLTKLHGTNQMVSTKYKVNLKNLQASFRYAWGHYKTTLLAIMSLCVNQNLKSKKTQAKLGGIPYSIRLVASSKSDTLGGEIPLEVDILLVLLKVSHTPHEIGKPSKLTDPTFRWHPTKVCTGSCVEH